MININNVWMTYHAAFCRVLEFCISLTVAVAAAAAVTAADWFVAADRFAKEISKLIKLGASDAKKDALDPPVFPLLVVFTIDPRLLIVVDPRL